MHQLWSHNPPKWTQPRPPADTLTYAIRQVRRWDGSQLPDPRGGLGQHIHPSVAMLLAGQYGSASQPGLTRFAVSGTVIESLIPELLDLLMLCEPEQVAELRALLAYVRSIDPSPERRSAHSGR
jgi:hypothetical protein